MENEEDKKAYYKYWLNKPNIPKRILIQFREDCKNSKKEK